MVTLEDKLKAIVELRMSGLDETAIAERLEISSDTVNQYEQIAESYLREALKKGGAYNAQKIGHVLNLSPIVVDLLVSYFQIPYQKEKSGSKKFKSHQPVSV